MNARTVSDRPDEVVKDYALVKTEGTDHLVLVPIGSHKPPIPVGVQEKWQKIVDLVAEILHVPTGLITRLTGDALEIFAAAQRKGNPYKRNDKDNLGIGMFCETVAGRGGRLVVEDSEKSSYWKNNPHAALGMKAYLGVPIKWEDGELFGTFCMLDDKANTYSDEFIKLVEQFRDIIESDLESILLREDLAKRLGAKELQLREIHHRLKNQFNLLTGYINLKAGKRDAAGQSDAFKEIKQRVAALSLIHEELYRSEDIVEPALDEYLPRLGRYILADFLSDDVQFTWTIEKTRLSMEREITLALILSELLTNSIKHAFNGADPKKITLAIGRNVRNNLTMVYRDSGIGVPDGFDIGKTDTLGMMLLRGLTEQLDGTVRVENSNGAVFSFEFGI